MTGLTTGFDPLIELRNPLSSVLQTQSCTTSLFTCAVNLDQALTDNGIYYLNLSDPGTDDAGAYTLDLEQYPPAGNPLVRVNMGLSLISRSLITEPVV